VSARKRLIVPGVPRQTAGGLILPGDPAPAPRIGMCTVPGCDRDGTPFYAGQEQEWQRHVGWCSKRNRDKILEVIQEHKDRLPIFRDDTLWDPEVKEHMRKVGARMLDEGRLTVKPSERAGFS